MKKHNEQTIINELRRYFQNGYNYRIDNAFIFSCDWESDFFCTNREGWSFEFEVKISRSDFKADLKKKKHEVFKNATITQQYMSRGAAVSIVKEKRFIPNRFYYVVPEGLITKTEVPEYAGLIVVGNYLSIIKRAPFIHRKKFDFRKTLCDKFYHRWIDEKRRNNLLNYDQKKIIEKIEKLKEKYPDEFSELYYT